MMVKSAAKTPVTKYTHQTHFKRALKKAVGKAQQVIAVFVDVRGFSAFSSSRDSVDIGLYIRRLFLGLINTYFKGASYYKSTGDGMLIVYPYQEKNLTKVAENVIDACVAVYVEFKNIAAGDEMITFNAPGSCGIGINRGTVCCIESEGETLDYSGHVLNLASRLTDLARPEGIVMHGSLGNLIPDHYKEIFEISSVYVRGMDENQPVPIYSLMGVTTIPASATVPPVHPWGEYSKTWKATEAMQLARFTIDVPNLVTKNEDVLARLYTPGSIKGLRTIHSLDDFKVKKVADKTEVTIELSKFFEKNPGLDPDVDVTLSVKYRQ